MAANPNGENEWVSYKNATCLIEAGISRGTGFLFGETGWVMSVAHNFQNDDTDPEQLHTLLSQASFRFTVNGDTVEFPGRSRMAFIHHLQPGDNVDPNNMDIAMVKLGKQYGYDRTEFQPWEELEETQLQAIQLQPVFATLHPQQAARNDTVHAIHYAGEEPNVARLTVAGVEGNPDNPIMRLQPALQPGASGCPIIKNFKLVGLLVGGGEEENPDATDKALMWNHGIQQFISQGVGIIANIEGYLAHRNQAINQPQPDRRQGHEENAENERQQLERRARNARLTIYLMNGDVINGPEATNN